jgi:hypothetical protein
MRTPRYPALYQANTRVWLTELSRQFGRRATLDDIPDAELDHLAELGFDWVWLLGVWQTGEAGREVSRSRPEWRREFGETLPDLREEDIGGSCFAITGYQTHTDLGGDAALSRLRDRLRDRGLRLMLDFVPNHTALDHPWTRTHSGFYIRGSDADLAGSPANWCRVDSGSGHLVLAHGRDPYFPGWPDTLQLNYGNPDLQEAMSVELLRIAALCDGVRCDMAMLVLPEVFAHTWGIRAAPFWPQAIGRVRRRHPGFLFMAEVYWNLEWALQQQGFDYAYDKRLYDRLRDGDARPVRDHLRAGLDFQDRLARFLENHDEPRAAVTFPPDVHQAAAVVSFLAPGLRFFHHGQFQGRTRRISPHLVRMPAEPVSEPLAQFYRRLLELLRQPALRQGEWRLLECVPAWENNWTWECYICKLWQGEDDTRLLVTVNCAANQSQCLVRLPSPEPGQGVYRFQDLMGPSCYDRDAGELAARGLYLDMPPWGYHVFRVKAV